MKKYFILISGIILISILGVTACKKKEPTPIPKPAKLNSYFIGTHTVIAHIEEEVCLNGIVTTYTSQTTYTLSIVAGSADNEIIINNLGGIGINGVKAIVYKDQIECLFFISLGQTLVDNLNRTWQYEDIDDIRGYYTLNDGCKNFRIFMSRPTTCMWSTNNPASHLDYWQEAATSQSCF